MIGPIPLTFCWKEKTVDLSRKMPLWGIPREYSLAGIESGPITCNEDVFPGLAGQAGGGGRG